MIKLIILNLLILTSFAQESGSLKPKEETKKLMVQSGLKNLVPDHFASSLKYNQLLKNTRKKGQTNSHGQASCSTGSCGTGLNKSNPILNKNAQDIQGLLNINECTCSAWNNCPDKKCTEKEVCPFDLSIFKITSHQRNPLRDNQLSFRNHTDAIPYEEITGFCWGHATSTQRLNSLAIYDPSSQPPFPEGTPEWTDHYKKIIDEIMLNSEAKIIPGFKNLYEFSSHPELKKYFGEMVAKVWSKQAMHIKAIADVGIKLKQKKQDKYFEDVKELIDAGVNPVIVVAGGLKNMGSSHVIIPWRIEGDNICYNDNSMGIIENIACLKTDDVYKEYFNLSYHYKEDLAAQAKSLQKLCEIKFKENKMPGMSSSSEAEELFDKLLSPSKDELIKLIKEQRSKIDTKEGLDIFLAGITRLTNKHEFNPKKDINVSGLDLIDQMIKLTKESSSSDNFVDSKIKFDLESEEKSHLFKNPDEGKLLYIKNIDPVKDFEVLKDMFERIKENDEYDPYDFAYFISSAEIKLPDDFVSRYSVNFMNKIKNTPNSEMNDEELNFHAYKLKLLFQYLKLEIKDKSIRDTIFKFSKRHEEKTGQYLD